MNTEYKRENHKSYLVVKNQEEDKENYDLKMLCSNYIKGLLPISFHVFNGEEELYYDISTKQPLSILYEKREMGKEDLEKLFIGMKNAVNNLEEYLLDVEGFLPEPNHIYSGGGGEQLYLLYYPYEKADFQKKIYEFAEYILTRVCNEDEKAVVYAYSFYRYIKEENGDLQEALVRLELDEKNRTEPEKDTAIIKEQWENRNFIGEDGDMGLYIEDETVCPVDEPKEQEGQSCYKGFIGIVFFIVSGLLGMGIIIYSTWKYNLTWQSLFSQTEAVAGAGVCIMSIAGMILFKGMEYFRNRKRTKVFEKQEELIQEEITDSYCEDVCEPVFGKPDADRAKKDAEKGMEKEREKDFETVLLQENCYHEQRVLRGRVKGRKKEIDLSTFPFIIGKNREQVDYVLEDNSISRIHARFTLRDDVVYLTDLNSTNGTLKNGIRLEPNELTMLEADDEITFGRLTFTYH